MTENDIKRVTANLTYIKFQNNSGFVIGTFANEEGEFSGLGQMLHPNVGLEYALYGEWSRHHTYGLQFKFVRYETIQPKDTDGIYAYLVRNLKWVGPTTGQALIEMYGQDTLTVLRKEPDRVIKEIPGLTEERILDIQQKLEELEAIEHVLIEIEQIVSMVKGIRKSLPFDLIEAYGSDAAEVLRENPYVLTKFANIGFVLADRVAIVLKFDRESIFRKSAGVIHTLKENESNGNVWMHGRNLVEAACSILGVEHVDAGIDALLYEEAIVEIGDWVAIKKTDKDETYCADKICRLLS